MLEVDQPDQDRPQRPVLVAVLHRHALCKQPVHPEVLLQLGLRLGSLKALHRFVNEIEMIGVDSARRFSQPVVEVDLLV